MTQWIEHDGKGCPVDDDTIVSVRLRDGYESDSEGQPASFWDGNWDHWEICDDIVAYRVVKS